MWIFNRHRRTTPARAYIVTIQKANKRVLTSQLFHKDDGTYYGTETTTGGNIISLEGPLMLDLFQQSRLLVNGISILVSNYDRAKTPLD